ncbi:MAG: hypothetical protein Q4Q53_01415 [Methanocorpusculum sp.]|nr:hypothetical protein [Methanocorpusculum sp.]
MPKEFECLQCGLCCLGIGEIVRMDSQISQYEFVVKNEVVSEQRNAVITPEYRELFDSDKSIQEEHRAACFFVRKRADGKFVCTIHPYRLFICKDYGCCTARIYKDGKEVGRIKNKFSLVTKDDVLREIWLENVQKTDNSTQKHVDDVLKSHGYSGVFYGSD